MRIAERGERIEARTDDDGRRHGVRIEVRIGVRIQERRGDDGAGSAVTTPRRHGDDGARTTARRLRGHGDDGGQVLAITTSASMTRVRQHGDDGAATTRRAGCGHDNAGRRRGDGYPQLSSLRSSLRSSFDPHSDPHSDPPSILTPILTPILTLPSEEPSRQFSTSILISILTPILFTPTLTPMESGRMPCMPRCCGGPRPATSAADAASRPAVDSDAIATSRDPGCHQCREWRGEQNCGLGMEDMTGELIMALPKDCFAGCSDDDATTTQRRLARCPHRLPLRIEAGRDDATG